MIETIGLIKFKNAKGRNTNGEIPNVAIINAPQVLQGTRGEVKVPASS